MQVTSSSGIGPPQFWQKIFTPPHLLEHVIFHALPHCRHISRLRFLSTRHSVCPVLLSWLHSLQKIGLPTRFFNWFTCLIESFPVIVQKPIFQILQISLSLKGFSDKLNQPFLDPLRIVQGFLLLFPLSAASSCYPYFYG